MMKKVKGKDVKVGDTLLVRGYDVQEVVAIETGQDTLERTIGDRYYMKGRAVLLHSVLYNERIGWRRLDNEAEVELDEGLKLNQD